MIYCYQLSSKRKLESSRSFCFLILIVEIFKVCNIAVSRLDSFLLHVVRRLKALHKRYMNFIYYYHSKLILFFFFNVWQAWTNLSIFIILFHCSFLYLFFCFFFLFTLNNTRWLLVFKQPQIAPLNTKKSKFFSVTPVVHRPTYIFNNVREKITRSCLAENECVLM